MTLIVFGVVLMVGVEIGRRKERAETPAKIEAACSLCIEYVAELGNELESEKRKNRELLNALN
ncbi:hypothetical protein KAR91_31785 [Candidatus Pacearchaeota archaeon]|nr:hypothetical protein [Candidatus Pacearchaeota archaeon]